MQTMSSPTHKVPAHPGADDDTDDEEELNQDAEIKEPKEEIAENKYEPIKNLVEDPPSETEDDH